MFGELEKLSRDALCATQTLLNKKQTFNMQPEKYVIKQNEFLKNKIDLCSCTLLKRGQVHLKERKSADIGGFDEWTRKKDIYFCPIKKWPESGKVISPNLCQ